MKVKIDEILASPECQARQAMCEETIQEYIDRLKDGEEAPAIILFYDGMTYWLADGFHRFQSYQRAGKEEIEAEVREGSRRDARLFACGANAGLRRTNADKRKAVTMLLNDEEWKVWSDREIARRTGVSAPFVAALRNQVQTVGTCGAQEPNSEPVRRGSDGKVYRLPRKTAGKSQAKTSTTQHSAGKSDAASPDLEAVAPEGEREGPFDYRIEAQILKDFLASRMRRWPAEKQHAYCVQIRNFTVENDLEWKYRTLDAIDRHFLPKPGELE